MSQINEGDTVSIKFTSGEEIIARFISDDGAVINIQRPMALVCLLYTSPSPRDGLLSRMPSSA